MDQKKESSLKRILDNILIYNLYVLIIGALFLATSFIFSVNGKPNMYIIFQKMWYPIFIPALSIFFTAILLEAVMDRLNSSKNN